MVLLSLISHISGSLWETSSNTETIVRNNQTILRKLSLPLQAINDGVPVAQQQTEDIKVRVSNTQDDVRNLRKDVSMHQKEAFEYFTKLDQSIDKGTENIASAIAKRLDQYMDRLLTLQNFESGKQRNEIEALVSITTEPRYQLTLPQNQKITSLQIGMISQPSLLRSVCDQYDEINNYPEPYLATPDIYSRLRRSTKNRGQCCGCQSSLRGSASKSYYLALTRKLHWRMNLALHLLSHRPSCPLLHTYIISAKGCGTLLARAVEVSITITRGAGGFSISPVMQCLRVVPHDSPAFKLVDWSSALKRGLVKSTTEFDNILLDNFSKIVLLFEAGKASAHDVDPHRESLLHVRTEMMLLFKHT